MPYKNKVHQGTNVIAIDGPAGSGKSTVAKELASRLDWLYIDTGAMYRAVTFKAINEGIDLNNEQALVALTRKTDIQLKMQAGSLKVIVDGEDLTGAIRQQSITEKVRFVARLAGVRRQMVKLQRGLVEKTKGAVLEGRDIGTVVFPNARYKFYLDADINERIKRRFRELEQMGEAIGEEKVSKDISIRDKSDMTRKIAPLARAKDAVYIDTTDLSVQEVVEKIVQRCSM